MWPANPPQRQMEGMRAHVAQAMRAGAVGIATALIYPPYSFQSTDELIDLARVVADVWRHLRQPYARRERQALAGHR